MNFEPRIQRQKMAFLNPFVYHLKEMVVQGQTTRSETQAGRRTKSGHNAVLVPMMRRSKKDRRIRGLFMGTTSIEERHRHPL